MTIKHIVISGGGHSLFSSLGAVYHLETNNFFKLQDIETIYATSVGAIIGLGLALKFDWETLNDYFVKRPWKEIFPLKVQNILDAYTKKGLYDTKTIEKCFKPLFDAKDIPLNINFEDLYKLTKMELHFFGFDINSYKIEDMSHLTHPNLSIITAIHISCSFPILFVPVIIDDKCYIDGGTMSNYPLKYCIESGKNLDEILGFKNKYSETKNNITDESTLIDFLTSFLYKAIFCLSTDYTQPEIQNEVTCRISHFDFTNFTKSINSSEARKLLFDNGVESGKMFLSKINKKDKDTQEELENSIQELN